MAKKNQPKSKRQPSGKIKFEGSPLYNDVKSQQDFRRDINALYKPMEKEAQDKLRDIFRKHKENPAKIKSESRKMLSNLDKKYTAKLKKSSERISKQMINKSLKMSDVKLQASLKKMTGGKIINTNVKSKSLDRLVSRSVKQNVKIISSIPHKYLNALKKSVYQVADGEGTLTELDNRLSTRRGQSKRYINNVSMGQTNKFFNDSNTEKMKSIGLKSFKWVYTWQAITPRHNHILMNGKIYSFDNLPVIELDGARGKPGDAYGCHCIMAPVIGNFEEIIL